MKKITPIKPVAPKPKPVAPKPVTSIATRPTSAVMSIEQMKAEMMAKSGASHLKSIGPSLPTLSTKGRRWTITKENQRQELPNTVIKVVIIGTFPSDRPSRAYFEKDFTEASTAQPPDCSSRDGYKPDTWVSNKQAPTCDVCPNAAWGSKISGNGKKIMACGQHRMVVVLVYNSEGALVNIPLSLRVAATSMKPLAKYKDAVEASGSSLSLVVTELRFTANDAFPKIDFSQAGPLSDSDLAIAFDALNSSEVAEFLRPTPSGTETILPGVKAEEVEEEEDEEEVAATPVGAIKKLWD